MMAGTWLDIVGRDGGRKWVQKARTERGNGGGRHWTRTSDLLHVKQVQGRSERDWSVTGAGRSGPAQRLGWTLAGTPMTHPFPLSEVEE